MKPKIGIHYNAKINGITVISLARSVIIAGGDYEYLDYRRIIYPHPGLQQSWRTKDSQLIRTIRRAKKQAIEMTRDIDALALPGADISVNPNLYENYTKRIDSDTDIARSLAEMVLLHVCIMQGKPILAICAGLQLFNVYIGGSIKTLEKHEYLAQLLNPEIEFALGSTLQQTLGMTRRIFMGSHKDVVDNLGICTSYSGSNIYTAVAHADDGNIEAIESVTGAPILAVQCHPEIDCVGVPCHDEHLSQYVTMHQSSSNADEKSTNINIFRSFVEAANTYVRKQVCNARIQGLSTEQVRHSQSRLGALQCASIKMFGADTRNQAHKQLATLKERVSDVNKIIDALPKSSYVATPSTVISYVVVDNKKGDPNNSMPPSTSIVQAEIANRCNLSIPMALLSSVPTR